MLGVINNKIITSNGKLCTTCCEFTCPCPNNCYWFQLSGCDISHNSHMQKIYLVGTEFCSDPMEAIFINDDNNNDTQITLVRSLDVLTLTYWEYIDGVKHYWTTTINDTCLASSYILDFDYSEFGDPVCSGSISATIEQELCCGSGNPVIGPYYISCDIKWDEWSDVDCDMTDCSGNGGGGNTSHDIDEYNVITDISAAIAETDPCYMWTDTLSASMFPDCGENRISIVRLVTNEWQVIFGQCAYSTGKFGGLTPVGTYPDIDYCYNDGCYAVHISITNIVVTQ